VVVYDPYEWDTSLTCSVYDLTAEGVGWSRLGDVRCGAFVRREFPSVIYGCARVSACSGGE
jgi:hypothetical protein